MSSRPIADEVCVLETTLGVMTLRFFPDEAPETVTQFKNLVADGFYDSREFYRVVAGHVIQAGDRGDSMRPCVKGEFGAYPHVIGAVGLARREDPDSGSTDFYICLAPRPQLDGLFAVFGLLEEGLDVLEAIGNVEVEELWEEKARIAVHRPRVPVVIERAHLQERELS